MQCAKSVSPIFGIIQLFSWATAHLHVFYLCQTHTYENISPCLRASFKAHCWNINNNLFIHSFNIHIIQNNIKYIMIKTHICHWSASLWLTGKRNIYYSFSCLVCVRSNITHANLLWHTQNKIIIVLHKSASTYSESKQKNNHLDIVIHTWWLQALPRIYWVIG